jgi:hypothetical protein
MTWTNQRRPEAGVDIECFHNWFLIGITDATTGTEWDYQMIPGTRLDVGAIETLLRHYTVVTFNGVNYDLPMLLLALSGADCAQLKQANDEMIVGGMKWWVMLKKYGLRIPDWIDHIDVMEPTPGVRVTLKQYACRLHSKKVQDSPVDFKVPIDHAHIPQEVNYCRNDRRVTLELREAIKSRIDLRIKLSERYGIDLRSKSDAQMAEAMVKVEWSRRLRVELDNLVPSVRDYEVKWDGTLSPIIPKFAHGHKFKCIIPEYVHFVTPYMQSVLELVRNCEFTLTDKDEALLLSDGTEELGPDGKKLKTGVVMPPELKGLDIHAGGSTFRMGIGGLHSKEKKTTVRSIPGVGTLTTADVAAYYPTNIVNSAMNPPQLGPLFQEIYGGFKRERDVAKTTLPTLPVGEEYNTLKTVTDGFKIVNNGTFGKLFSRHSIFYHPQMGITVTVGYGQLSLLMLIERLTISGIRVMSANTDGIEMFVPDGYEGIRDNILAWWERTCNLTLEVSSYLALCSESVNSYISLQFDGSVKRKGRYGRSGVISPDATAGKHPDIDVCAEAVVAYLSKGTLLSQTIRGCNDIRKFIRVRGAKGGARMSTDLPDMNYGRAIRWYYSTTTTGDYIVDAQSGNKVAGSDGAKLCMDLPDALPADIDYHFYENVAEKMLLDMGIGG